MTIELKPVENGVIITILGRDGRQRGYVVDDQGDSLAIMHQRILEIIKDKLSYLL